MKKIVLAGLILSSSCFALSLEERVQLLEQKVSNLEKKLNIVDKSQNQIKQEIKNNVILKCNKLKLLQYSYEYENAGFTQSYLFKYKFQNNYNKPIKYIYGSISYTDNEDTTMVVDYVKNSIDLKPHQTMTIKTNYLIDNGSLAEYLKDTPKNKLKVIFKPFIIQFNDGQKIECN